MCVCVRVFSTEIPPSARYPAGHLYATCKRAPSSPSPPTRRSLSGTLICPKLPSNVFQSARSKLATESLQMRVGLGKRDEQ